MVQKYHDSQCRDKEVLISIRKAVDAYPELRSKKQLIETIIAGFNDVDDDLTKGHHFVADAREKDLDKIITDEGLKEEETRKFIHRSFCNGELKTIGTEIDSILPPMSLFNTKRAEKKQIVIDKLISLTQSLSGMRISTFIGTPSSDLSVLFLVY